MTPATARAFWEALVDNAARLVVEADTLFPSPRAQSLLVLAEEEVGKAVWVSRAFWSAWGDGDETPLEVSELREHGRRHVPKLVEALDFWTAVIDVPDSPKPVDVELVRKHAPELLVAYLTGEAHADDQAKQKGFYVDLDDDGTISVPHEIERPDLRSHIWGVADMVQWLITDDGFMASVARRPMPPTREVEALLGAVLARGRDD